VAGFTASASTTYDALNITGEVIVNANNVTFTRCKFNDRMIGTIAGATNPIQGNNLLVQDCEFDGGDVDGATSGNTMIWMGHLATFERCNIHSAENGAHAFANAGSFIDCYFHDLLTELGGEPQPHTDGIQSDTDVSFLTVDHCHFYQPTPATSSINIYNESDGTANHLTINNNLFRTNGGNGGGYAAYFPRFAGWSNISFTNNVVEMGDKGAYFDSEQNVTTWSGNVDYNTGATITNT